MGRETAERNRREGERQKRARAETQTTFPFPEPHFQHQSVHPSSFFFFKYLRKSWARSSQPQEPKAKHCPNQTPSAQQFWTHLWQARQLFPFLHNHPDGIRAQQDLSTLMCQERGSGEDGINFLNHYYWELCCCSEDIVGVDGVMASLNRCRVSPGSSLCRHSSHDCYWQAVLGDTQAENLECSQTHIPDTQPQIWAPGNWPGCQKCFSSNVMTVGKRGEGESPSQLPGLKKKERKNLVKRKEIGLEKALAG